jgi:ABC-type multidrug transport system ATPase subunit
MMAALADNLSKRYKTPVFSGVGFHLAPGEGLGIYGPNGSGKTTLLEIVCGLTRPDSGSVRVGGRIGYVPQRDGLSPRLTALDNLRFYAALAGLRGKQAARRIAACAEACGAETFLRKRLNRCSAGMRQRVSVAAAMLNEPAVLLLDEVFAPLDAEGRASLRLVLEELRRSGTALMLVSHDSADFMGLCTRGLSMPDGSLTAL